ncbi:MAG: M48 family metallopeptidase [Opitutales bacterium]
MIERNAAGPYALTEVETEQGRWWLPYELKPNPRSRHLRLSLGYQNQAVLTVPRGVSSKAALAFLREHAGWVETQIEASRRVPSLRLFLERRPWLNLDGAKMRIQFHHTAARPRVLRLRAEPSVHVYFSFDHEPERALLDLVRRLANQGLRNRVEALARKAEAGPNKVTVRDQRSRWGSLSTSGTLSLNWRLVLLPPPLGDYVIFHELAHLREFNHSRAFWAVVRGWDPRYRQHERELARLEPQVLPLGRRV